jgi:hypothetical protein
LNWNSFRKEPSIYPNVFLNILPLPSNFLFKDSSEDSSLWNVLRSNVLYIFWVIEYGRLAARVGRSRATAHNAELRYEEGYHMKDEKYIIDISQRSYVTLSRQLSIDFTIRIPPVRHGFEDATRDFTKVSIV